MKLKKNVCVMGWTLEAITAEYYTQKPTRVFHEHTELTIMTILASQTLLHESKKKNPTTKLL